MDFLYISSTSRLFKVFSATVYIRLQKLFFKISFSSFQVTESDIALAKRFDAIIYAFNTAVPAPLAKAADAASVPVRPFNVIYHLVDDLKQVGLPLIR